MRQVTSTSTDFPRVEPGGPSVLNESTADFPLFSPITWAAPSNPTERYPSPDVAGSSSTAYPMANGINGRLSSPPPTTRNDDGSNQLNAAAPPPIDEVDIGPTAQEVARFHREGVLVAQNASIGDDIVNDNSADVDMASHQVL